MPGNTPSLPSVLALSTRLLVGRPFATTRLRLAAPPPRARLESFPAADGEGGRGRRGAAAGGSRAAAAGLLRPVRRRAESMLRASGTAAAAAACHITRVRGSGSAGRPAPGPGAPGVQTSPPKKYGNRVPVEPSAMKGAVRIALAGCGGGPARPGRRIGPAEEGNRAHGRRREKPGRHGRPRYGSRHVAWYETSWTSVPTRASPYGARSSLNHSGASCPPPSPAATAVPLASAR